MNKCLKRLKEPSTLRGIFMLAGTAGVSIAPELQEQIILLCGGIIGVLGVLTEDVS